jgi:predicted transcriptional regulator
MKTVISFNLPTDLNQYLRDIAHQERQSISEILRQMIEDHRDNNDPTHKIKIIDDRIEELKEQQRQLTYQRDYLKDRIEEK